MKREGGRNRIRLLSGIEDESHFSMHEFENAEGWVMVHSSVVVALEKVRRDLCAACGEEVAVLVRDSTRTERDLHALAARFGWTDEGGLVSRDSKHLARYGGVAVDIVARVVRTRERVPQQVLGNVCRRYFDFVKDDYADGHVHADNRGLIPSQA